MFTASTCKPNSVFQHGYSSKDLAWSVLPDLDLKKNLAKNLICLFNSVTAFKDDV